MKNLRNVGLLALGLALILSGAAFYYVGADRAEPEKLVIGGASPDEVGLGSDLATSAGSAQSGEFVGSAGSGESGAAVEPRTDLPVMQVWKSPTCGCCSGWVDHLRAEGIRVETHDVQNLAQVKAEHGVPSAMASCHTGVIGDYVVEGHVPAEDILRLLEEQPSVAGVAVPGMPMGSPGMEYGDRAEAYQTLAFQKDGSSTVWARH